MVQNPLLSYYKKVTEAEQAFSYVLLSSKKGKKHSICYRRPQPDANLVMMGMKIFSIF